MIAVEMTWVVETGIPNCDAPRMIVAAVVSYTVLHANARDEVLQNARMMMESASASGDYTNAQVRPLLETQLKYKFIPQSVPAFAATEQFKELRKNYPDYTFKAATVNPTNPRNHATDWEVDIVNQFRQSAAKTEVIGERATQSGRSLYLARPIQIKDPACLTCHSTPDAAPRTMVETYGSANGFGWKVNEIVGANIVSVPTSVPVQRANYTFRIFLLSLLAMFAFTIGMLNVMLYWFVIRRVKRLSKLADEVSLGNLDAGEFQTQSKDEIGVLTEALGRMKTSMVQAIKMLDAHG